MKPQLPDDDVAQYQTIDQRLKRLEDRVSSLALLPSLRVVGAVGQPAFQNGWAVASGSYPLRFGKDPFGEVFVVGSAAGGASGTVAFTLPSTCWPSYTLIGKALQASDVAGSWWAVDTVGNVALTHTTGTVYLDFSFKTY